MFNWVIKNLIIKIKSKEELVEWISNLTKYFLIYLYPEDGRESDMAAQMLREKGFSECLSVIGGLKEWKQRYVDRHIILVYH